MTIKDYRITFQYVDEDEELQPRVVFISGESLDDVARCFLERHDAAVILMIEELI